MKTTKFLKGQRLIFNNEEIVQFIELNWDGSKDLAWVKAIDGNTWPVDPKQLKPLPKGQL